MANKWNAAKAEQDEMLLVHAELPQLASDLADAWETFMLLGEPNIKGYVRHIHLYCQLPLQFWGDT